MVPLIGRFFFHVSVACFFFNHRRSDGPSKDHGGRCQGRTYFRPQSETGNAVVTNLANEDKHNVDYLKAVSLYPPGN